MKTFTEETIKFSIEFSLKPELEPGGMYDDPRELMAAYDAAAYNQFTQCKNFDKSMLERKYIHLRYITLRDEIVKRLTLKKG